MKRTILAAAMAIGMGWTAVAGAGEPTSSAEFQSTLWRMTAAQVQALYPSAVATVEGLSLVTTVEERPADLTFTFVHDQLAEVRVDFPGQQDPTRAYAELYQRLGKRYGAAAVVIDPRETAYEQAKVEHEKTDIASFLVGVAPGRYSFVESTAVGIAGNQQYAAATAAAATMRPPESAVWFVGAGRIDLATDPQTGALHLTYGYRPLINQAVGASRVAPPTT
jgi:hypothetical protein